MSALLVPVPPELAPVLALQLVEAEAAVEPAIARVKVKRDIPDIRTIFLPIISSPPFPSHIYKKRLTK